MVSLNNEIYFSRCACRAEMHASKKKTATVVLHDLCTNIFQSYVTGTRAMLMLPKWQWSSHEEWVKMAICWQQQEKNNAYKVYNA